MICLNKKNIFGYIILFTFLLVGCSKEEDKTIIDSQSFILRKRIIEVNDTISIKISELNSDFEGLNFSWSTNFGKIVPNGEKAVFYAPNTNGVANITVSIFDQYKYIKTLSLEIIVFKQIVILKADDLIFLNSTVSNEWKNFIDYIKFKKIKCSLGLIGYYLSDKSNKDYSYLKELVNSGLFEIWNHGYTHFLNRNENGLITHEFWNTTYEFQKERLLLTQNIAKEKLNITIRSFGAPGNYIDINTLIALEEVKEIKVWFYGNDSYSNLKLSRTLEIEVPFGKPNLNSFTKDHKNFNGKLLVLQIHPNLWDENCFNEFKEIIDFLINNNSTFMNPYEYYLSNNYSNSPPP